MRAAVGFTFTSEPMGSSLPLGKNTCKFLTWSKVNVLLPGYTMRILLISFRDTVIFPRYNVLKATFSRLSLESTDASLATLTTNGGNTANSSDRPSTAQSLDPNFASAYNGKGNALSDLKRYQEALAAYEQAIRLDPNYANAYNNKGHILKKLNRNPEAEQAFQKARQLFIQSPFNLADVPPRPYRHFLRHLRPRGLR